MDQTASRGRLVPQTPPCVPLNILLTCLSSYKGIMAVTCPHVQTLSHPHKYFRFFM